MGEGWTGRASAAYAAMREAFYIPRLGLYRESIPHFEHPFSYCWPFARAMAATNDLVDLHAPGVDDRAEVAARIDGLERYWDGKGESYASAVVAPLGDGGDAYYDDNAWAGLELVRTYRLTGDIRALERARAVLRFLLGGWDDDPRHPSPGGVYWVAAGWNDDRNTVSTAPSALLALDLAALETDGERQREYVGWARRMADWVDTTLRRDDGLYADHIALDGTVDHTVWSYNQGTMIGLQLSLYRVTGDDRYRADAWRTASAARGTFTVEALQRQDLAFNAIYLSHLARFATTADDDGWLDAPREYAERLWTERRDPATGLATTSRPLTLLDQSAFVSIFAILAALDATPRRSD